MAKRRGARRRSRAIVRSVGKAVGRVRRRKGGGGRGMLGGLIPDTGTLMNAGIGGAGYAAAKGLAGKFLPSMSPMINGLIAAGAIHVVGNTMFGKRDIGVAAIGALASDLVRESGILDQLGMSDYFADYFRDDVVHLGIPGGGAVRVPVGGGIHDPGRRHRYHDGGAYGESYGAN